MDEIRGLVPLSDPLRATPAKVVPLERRGARALERYRMQANTSLNFPGGGIRVVEEPEAEQVNYPRLKSEA